jgi:hypothetical protein
MITELQLTMAVCLFVLGLGTCVAGIWTILAKEYRQMLRQVSAQSAKASSKAVVDVGMTPLVEAMTGLLNAINQLVRTSVGVGVFLCIAGGALCLLAFWMTSGV